MSWLLWLKALHIVAVISWMAGLLYLPRLMVYHVDAEPGSVMSETFKIMERRLLRYIMTPAMIVVWITGPVLAWQLSVYLDTWLIVKFVLVLAMSGFHDHLARWQRAFAVDTNTHSAKFFRMVNEIPTVLMIAIVILVVIKPF